jgi:mannose-binding lectin 1
MWFLHNDMDPSKHTVSNYLSGPIVGLRTDFHGFGIVFDTYDNDNMRDNPSVFVVKNFPSRAGQPAGEFQFNHNADFAQDMIRDSPAAVYKCTLDYRNTEMPFTALVRYI